MARFHGLVGYGESKETPPGSGKWEDEMSAFPYTGDVISNVRNLEEGDKVNLDINVANSISIVADQYANEHFNLMKYVEWNGVRWIVTSVKVQRPRLILTIGGVYNGPTP
jgi:hypothetical protein